MNLTLAIDDEVVRRAGKRAEALGLSLNQMVRDYLEQVSDPADAKDLATRLRELSRASKGNSRGWKFNRDEIYQR